MAGLVDHLGRPVSTAALRREQGAPLLNGIRSVLTGHPASGLTPQRLAGMLRGAEANDHDRYLELAEEMEEKYLHYLSVLGTRKRAVCQLEITVDAASDDADHQAQADLIRTWLERDELEAELFDTLDAIGKGLSYTEIVWDTSEGQWEPARLEWRDPRWFQFDRADGRTPLIWNDAAQLEALNPYGWIVHEHKAKSGLPIRGGLARPAAWAYLFQNYSLKDWVAFAEIFGLPLRVGRYDNGETRENIELLMRAVAGVSTDAAAVFPKSMDVEFISGSGAGSDPAAVFGKLCEYLDQQISKAVLGQTATTDSVTGGLGSGKEHGDVRQDIERADAKLLATSLNRDLVRPMVDLNRGPQKKYPRIRIGRSEAWDPVKMMPAIKTYVELGGKVGSSSVRDKLGLEDPGEEEELLQAPTGLDSITAPDAIEGPPGAATPPGGLPTLRRRPAPRLSGFSWPLKGQPGAEGPPAAAAQSGGGATGGDAIDALAEDCLSDWAELVGPITRPIVDLVAASASLQEVRDQLITALATMDDAATVEMLARATFNARLAGLVGQGLADDQETSE